MICQSRLVFHQYNDVGLVLEKNQPRGYAMSETAAGNLAESEIEQLIFAAVEARTRAYAPYSRFLVGAALLVQTGEIFSGCNVENASYGATLCGERVAGAAAVAAGHQQWKAIAIVTPGGVSPCGICRQFLAEFHPALTVILADADHLDEPSSCRQLLSLLDLFPARVSASDVRR